MRFAALDVETANHERSSICQVGIAVFDSGRIVNEWQSLVDPKTDFYWRNVQVHGIDKTKVRGAPVLADVGNIIFKLLNGKVVASHSSFDRQAICQAFDKFYLRQPNCKWLDTVRVARRTWKGCSKAGYGLGSVCEMLGHKFQHHDALEDAKAAGKILVEATKCTGLDLERWLIRVNQPIGLARAGNSREAKRHGTTHGTAIEKFRGGTIVFTGKLDVSRCEARKLAVKIGWLVSENVTKSTTILCVGSQNLGQLSGYERSSKHRQADKLINNGQPIRIINETDFLKMVGHAQCS